MSCASAVEKTSGAPSMGMTIFGFLRQETSSTLTGLSGGGVAAWMAGSAMTMTDFGLRNEGGA